MKGSPFFFASAATMLAGCYILSEALALQPGHLGKLLSLMGVLQVYEWLLLAAGLFLVTTKRAADDGRTLLVLSSVFLMDAALLGTECVTASAPVGTAIAALSLGLAAAKLGAVRRFAPDLLSRRAALHLASQVALVLALPVVAAHLARAGWFGPLGLYGLWWLTLALPLVCRRMLGELPPSPSRWPLVWAALPTASILIHLAAVGWIHSIAFHTGFLSPFLLGLALVAGRERLVRQAVLPVVAVLFAVGQPGSVGFATAGVTASPVRLVLLAAATVYAALAWRYGHRWLIALAGACSTAGLLGRAGVGSVLSSMWNGLGRLLRSAEALVPRTAVQWGVLAVMTAFVLLAVGLVRSLRPTKSPPLG